MIFFFPLAQKKSWLSQHRLKLFVLIACTVYAVNSLTQRSPARRRSRSLRFCRGPGWILSNHYFAVITSVIQLRQHIPEPDRDRREDQ